MSMAEKPWFRAYAKMIDDGRLRLLAFEDRWHYIALLCLKRAGLLDKDESQQLRERMVAVKMGLQLRELEAVAGRLAEVGLIDAKTMQPLGWDEHQFVSDDSSSRVRKFRSKNHAADDSNEDETLHVTASNVSETPPETETETERASTLRVLVETRAASCDAPAPDEVNPGPAQPPTDVDNRATDAAPRNARCPLAEIVALYHETLPMLPRFQKLTKTRAGHVQQRWREDLQTIEDWRAFFQDVRGSPFLIGQKPGSDGRPPFRASLDWLCRPENFAKVYEGFYHR